MSWEDKFTTWAKPISDSLEERCENAERAIKEAIVAYRPLSSHNVKVFTQGSYKNGTNVRVDSDVDVCICLTSTFFYDLPEGMQPVTAGIYTPGAINYTSFRNLVEEALVAKFGRRYVTRGSKCFDIHENTYRIDADVVTAFQYREYTGQIKNGQYEYREGIKFYPDDGGEIINWPHHTYMNGLLKDVLTEMRYKKIVKILKMLRSEMQDNRIAHARDIGSFLIDSLVFNVPHPKFNGSTYTADVRNVLAHCFNKTLNDQDSALWIEVNEIKRLFHYSQPWTRLQAHNFLSAAWDYLGFV